MLTKPESVAADDFKSAKWDELTRGRSFEQADAPALALLCQWHKVAQQAMDELDSFGGHTAYQRRRGRPQGVPADRHPQDRERGDKAAQQAARNIRPEGA